ncbi:Fungal lipase-like domain [Arabidopsis suecica]|uniref:Phospholipase A1 n=1 Tax=Arabidopsis suecica TaxID=45249 RepID=A0A8T2AKF9_ARASU|nr:Fungal lipase-like domain [Arabidopsis suecica]
MAGDIAKRWKELSGNSKWKDLLDPLDLDLRRYILHYGDMAEVGYVAFNSDRRSKYVGDSCYTKEELFARTGYLKANPFRYEVTKYIYGTSSIRLPECFIIKSLAREAWNKESNWLGYIAVATDEGKKLLGRRDIVVAWRGTIQLYEWANDFDFPLESAVTVFPRANPNDEPRIANGWLSLYTSTDPRSRFDKTSAQEQVQGELKRLLELYKDEDITITLTGHSLGAVMSILSAADFLHNEWPKITPSLQHRLSCVTVFAFGSPRIGDRSFKRLVESLEHLHILRVTNVPDLIPRYPVFRFTDVGEELQINTLKSEYLKRSLNLGHFHNLEAYLHGVAGTQHNQGEFKLEINRDIALVNKGLDALEDKYLVPGHWWVLENKGMVQSDDGTWKLNGDRSKNKQEEEEEENNCKFP